MFRKRTILHIFSLICFIIACLLIIAIIKQDPIVHSIQQKHKTQSALYKQEKLTKNIQNYINVMNVSTNSALLGEIFNKHKIAIEDIPNGAEQGLLKVRLTDPKGGILYSNVPKEVGAEISQNILSWSIHSSMQPFILMRDKDILVGIVQYQNPFSIFPEDQGFMVFEFTSNALLQGLKGINSFLRIVKGEHPLFILTEETTIEPSLLSGLALNFSGEKIDHLPISLGINLNIPYLGKLLYYAPDRYFVPALFVLLIILFFVLSLASLFVAKNIKKSLLNKQNLSDFQDPSIEQLIQDIETGNMYESNNASHMMEHASKYGMASMENSSKYFDQVTDSEQKNTDQVYSESKDEFAFIHNDLEDDFNNITIPSDQELISSFDSIEQDTPIFDDVSINEHDIEHSEQQYADDDNNVDLINIEELSDDNTEQIENFSEIWHGQEIHNPTVFSKLQHLDEFLSNYEFTYNVVMEEKNNEFIPEVGIGFNSGFSITKNDPLYLEYLSQGKALDLSGDLQESSYLSQMFPSDVLSRLGEMIIQPILDEHHQVKAVSILARENAYNLLQESEKQKLFSLIK